MIIALLVASATESSQPSEPQNKVTMKRLSLLDLNPTEIKKGMLGKIKGGTDVKCLCSLQSPAFTTKEQGGQNLCACTDTPVTAGIHNRPNKND